MNKNINKPELCGNHPQKKVTQACLPIFDQLSFDQSRNLFWEKLKHH
ncbi:MAG: hypothetical protein WAL93_03520 [Desulfobacterales bacterium]